VLDPCRVAGGIHPFSTGRVRPRCLTKHSIFVVPRRSGDKVVEDLAEITTKKRDQARPHSPYDHHWSGNGALKPNNARPVSMTMMRIAAKAGSRMVTPGEK
jgi:hypothetical protein